MLNLIGLFDLNADANAVDTGLNEDSLVFISGNSERIEQNFWGGLRFDFRDIVSFRCL